MKKNIINKLTPSQLLISLFVILILSGTFFLMLPISTKSGHISFINALFTSTSAACVTGLIVVDTPHYFTEFGQIIILILIQIGGIGIMTFSSFITLMLGRKLGLFSYLSLKEDLNYDQLGDIKTLLIYVINMTFWFEFIGAIILWSRFKNLESVMHFEFSSVYLAIFHSISAFCNAGFSLFSNNLESFPNDPVINIVIMALIFFGGIGFFAILDTIKNKLDPEFILEKSIKGISSRKNKRLSSKTQYRKSYGLSLNTKIVLLVSILLIVIGGIFIFAIEYTNSPVFRTFSLKKEILISLFASVTPRTAGFDTIPMSFFSVPAIFFIIMLMFIGASPGSTGGGIKTTSLAVLILATLSEIKGQNKIFAFRKQLSWDLVHKALALVFISIVLIFVDTLLLSMIEKKKFLDLLFEVVSAFGTVGLSLGITSKLSILGKFIITVTMLIGRLGPLTFAISLSKTEKNINLSYPEENIMIG
jgi:trk system potassium uptake protein TrkH